MLIVAHRGGSPDHIDNSREAFKHGFGSAADLMECDVQLSASGEIIVYHDTKYFGASLSSFTTDELRGLVPTVLTFNELLELLETKYPAAKLVIDLKGRDVDRAIVPYLSNSLLRRTVIVTSTYSFGLWRLNRLFPGIRTGLSRGATFTRIPPCLRPLARRTAGRLMVCIAVAQMRLLGIGTAALQHDLIDGWTVGVLHRRGIRVDAWTVDSVARARALRGLGVDYLTTNVPAEITRLQSSDN